MATLNEHVKQFTSVSGSDDSKSTVSSTSSARLAEKCPCCAKEFQARVMFNHLRKLHPEYVKTLYGALKPEEMDELIKYTAPFPIDWEIMDDFDEPICKSLWGCLACNSTFTTQHNAQKHCLGKCKNDHNAHLRRIKKEEQQEKEKKMKKISDVRLRWINRSPAQIFACIQHNVTYYEKKFTSVSQKVVGYLCTMKHEMMPDHVFFPFTNIMFVDDKKQMEELETTILKEINAWQTTYNDILPELYHATHIVSHSAYDELYKLIKWTNDYADPKF